MVGSSRDPDVSGVEQAECRAPAWGLGLDRTNPAEALY